MKNIKLLYFLNSLYYTWFWLGTWVLYYREFGGFAAVGILETVMIVSTILFEIPTGAIGDLLGKKRTLLLGFALSGIANIWMGFAPSMLHMILSLVLLNFGGALRSGTFEAMTYDSLKDEGKESQFKKVNSKMIAIRLLTLATCGAIGGYLYFIWHSLPYILNGIGCLLGSVLVLFLIEPKIDSEKFTIRNYIKQNVIGFKQLFLTKVVAGKTLSILSITVITLIMYEGLNDILGVGFGFNEIQLGYLSAILSLAGAGASVLSSKLEEKIPSSKLYLFSIPLYVISLLISPFVGLYMGGISILMRNIINPVLENESSSVINGFVDSKYRATALSSFSMLNGLPYALLIYFIAAATDYYPATKVAFIIGIVMIFAGLLNWKIFGTKPSQLQG